MLSSASLHVNTIDGQPGLSRDFTCHWL